MSNKDIKVKDHITLFDGPEYKDMFERKREAYENAPSCDEVAKTLEWTKSAEYKDLNFSREHLVVNPLKACQPLGALYAAIGFDDTMPYVHGSQGCAAYFRSHFCRHFKEPFPTVSDSMTEDAAVFGGHNNMYVGLENVYKLYKPGMIAICTSCMAEVIGDDLNNFVKNAREEGSIPMDFPVTHAHTPSFVGSHITGYDNMLMHMFMQMGKKTGECNGKINVILGFDTYIENFREIKRIFKLFGVDFTLISDPSYNLDSPTNGHYEMFNGGTTLEELKDAPNAKATLLLQKYSTAKTIEYIEKEWGHPVKTVNPFGIKGADDLMMAISELSGKEVPAEIENERGRFVDAIGDSYYWIHGKSFSLNADPDYAIGITQILIELGADINHVVLTNGTKEWEKDMKALLAQYPQGSETEVYSNKDMWHFRSLLFEKPSDYIVGNTFAKYLMRDTGIPLIRIGFPIFDRQFLPRYATIGYMGGLNMVNWIVNTVLDEIDRKTMHTTSYDTVR
jgi:nitrogenase molybdenum-iron protein beta chain